MTVLETAIDLLEKGLWPVPITPSDDPRSVAPGKAPIGNDWGRTRHTAETLQKIYTHFPTAGVGIKLGPEGGVVDIDVDDPERGAAVIARMFGGKPPTTLGWRSTKGPHYVFRYDRRLDAYGKSIVRNHPHYPGVELRIGWSPDDKQYQSVVPPSVGGDGKPREWNGCEVIAALPESFYADLDAHLDAPAPAKKTPGTKPVMDARPRTDVENRAVGYLRKCDPAVSGENGHGKAFGVACRVGPGFDLSPETALRLIKEVYNPTCQPPWNDRELQHKIEEAYKVETRRGWLLNVDRPEKPNFTLNDKTGEQTRTYDFPLIVKGTSVRPKQVDWLWPNRIPYGFLTLFAGRTGVGKSFATLDLAARLSNGGEIPLGDGQCFERSSCLIISEDSHEYILAPRLIEAGADMERVNFMSWEAMASFTLADTDMLHDTYNAAGQPKFVVIDPPTNFLGSKDEHKNAEVRGVLMGVSIWAMQHDIACVLITHCNKGVKKDMAALDRVIGSVAWASTSRIAHMFAPHPDEQDQGVFMPLKSNIGKMPKGLSYEIVSVGPLARVKWLGEIDFSADDTLAGEKSKPRRVVAAEWLVEQFRQKRDWSSDDIVTAGKEYGLSRNSLFDAKSSLPIDSKRRVNAAGEPMWFWVARGDWPPPIEND